MLSARSLTSFRLLDHLPEPGDEDGVGAGVLAVFCSDFWQWGSAAEELRNSDRCRSWSEGRSSKWWFQWREEGLRLVVAGFSRGEAKSWFGAVAALAWLGLKDFSYMVEALVGSCMKGVFRWQWSEQVKCRRCEEYNGQSSAQQPHDALCFVASGLANNDMLQRSFLWSIAGFGW